MCFLSKIVKYLVDHYKFSSYTPAQMANTKSAIKRIRRISKQTLVNKARNTAEYYTQRFLDYIVNNSNLFPEYNQNQGGDVYPDSDATFNGWVL